MVQNSYIMLKKHAWFACNIPLDARQTFTEPFLSELSDLYHRVRIIATHPTLVFYTVATRANAAARHTLYNNLARAKKCALVY